MADKNQTSKPSLISSLLDPLAGLPWFNVLSSLWTILPKLLQGFAIEGMYEVLEYESTLELKDKKGLHATFRKRQKVRYLQDNIIAYQDQAWGDGEILLNYRCSPGIPVDRYRPGNKFYILISLRGVKNRGDEDEFHIEWKMHKSFLRRHEQWETEINHPTRHLVVYAVFPKKRPPLRVVLIEDTRHRSSVLQDSAQRQLPDGRWQVEWQTEQPRLHERYILAWEW